MYLIDRWISKSIDFFTSPSQPPSHSHLSTLSQPLSPPPTNLLNHYPTTSDSTYPTTSDSTYPTISDSTYPTISDSTYPTISDSPQSESDSPKYYSDFISSNDTLHDDSNPQDSKHLHRILKAVSKAAVMNNVLNNVYSHPHKNDSLSSIIDVATSKSSLKHVSFNPRNVSVNNVKDPWIGNIYGKKSEKDSFDSLISKL